MNITFYFLLQELILNTDLKELEGEELLKLNEEEIDNKIDPKQDPSLDSLTSIHNDIDEDKLVNSFCKCGFHCIKRQVYPLPNGKEYIRIDFSSNNTARHHM